MEVIHSDILINNGVVSVNIQQLFNRIIVAMNEETWVEEMLAIRPPALFYNVSIRKTKSQHWLKFFLMERLCFFTQRLFLSDWWWPPPSKCYMALTSNVWGRKFSPAISYITEMTVILYSMTTQTSQLLRKIRAGCYKNFSKHHIK